MNQFHLLIVSVFLFISSATLSVVEGFSQTKPTDTLRWKESKPLSWEDFRAKPKTGMSGEAFCQLDAQYEKPNPLKKTKFKIFAVWNKKNSWVATASKTADELLYYQVLFNIYEVHARKLRKELSEAKPGIDPEKTFREKYNMADASLTEECRNYREETEEGADPEKVKEWNEKINKQLKELSGFHE